jgi:hypothetical protein
VVRELFVKYQYSTDIEPAPRPERPLGVTTLSIWDGITAGVIPVITNMILLVQGSNIEQVSLVALCLAVGLPIAIITVSLGTFLGNDRARLFLLFLLTIFHGVNSFQNISMALGGTLSAGNQFKACASAVFSLLILGVNIWYFLRPKTIAYYRRPIKSLVR